MSESGEDAILSENKRLKKELNQALADKDFVWSLWKRLQVSSPNITEAISCVMQREKQKSDERNAKVLLVLQNKDQTITELLQSIRDKESALKECSKREVYLLAQIDELKKQNKDNKVDNFDNKLVQLEDLHRRSVEHYEKEQLEMGERISVLQTELSRVKGHLGDAVSNETEVTSKYQIAMIELQEARKRLKEMSLLQEKHDTILRSYQQLKHEHESCCQQPVNEDRLSQLEDECAMLREKLREFEQPPIKRRQSTGHNLGPIRSVLASLDDAAYSNYDPHNKLTPEEQDAFPIVDMDYKIQRIERQLSFLNLHVGLKNNNPLRSVAPSCMSTVGKNTLQKVDMESIRRRNLTLLQKLELNENKLKEALETVSVLSEEKTAEQQKLSRMRSTMKQSQSRCKQLQERVDSLEQAVQQQIKVSVNKQEKINQLRQDKRDLQHTVDDLRIQTQEDSTRLKEALLVLEGVQQERNSQHDSPQYVKEISVKLECAYEMLSHYKEEIEELRKRAISQEAMQVSIEKERDALKEELRCVTDELSSARCQLLQARKWKRQVNNSRKGVLAVGHLHRNKSQRMRGIMQHFGSCHMTHSDFNWDLPSSTDEAATHSDSQTIHPSGIPAKAFMQQRIASLQQQLLAMRQAKQRGENETKKLSTSNNQLKQEISSLKSRVTRLKEALIRASSDVFQCPKSNIDIMVANVCEQGNGDDDDEVDLVCSQTLNQGTVIRSLRSEAKVKDEKLKEQQERIARLERDSQCKRQMVEELRNRLKFTQDMNKADKTCIEDLQERIRHLQGVIDRHRSQMECSQIRLQTISQERAKYDQESVAAQREVTALEKTSNELRLRVKELEGRLHESQRAADTKANEVARKSSASIESAKKQLLTMQASLQECEQALLRVCHAIEITNTAMETLQTNTSVTTNNDPSSVAKQRAFERAASLLNLTPREVDDLVQNQRIISATEASNTQNKWIHSIQEKLKQMDYAAIGKLCDEKMNHLAQKTRR